MQYGGTWTAHEVVEKILTISEHDRREAILCQLKYYKTVLGAKGDRKLFYASHKGKKLETVTLKQNLL